MSTTQTAAAFASLETVESLTPAQIEERARNLRDQLSLDEKVSVMHGQPPLWPGLAAMTAPGGYSGQCWVAGAVQRLGIPGIRFSDGPRGVILEGATTFPVSMARGATWDPVLEERVGDAIGRELRALGGQLFRGRVHQPAAPPGLGPRPGNLRRRSPPVGGLRGRVGAACSATRWRASSILPLTRWRTPASRWT
jgi:hypothetical protein